MTKPTDRQIEAGENQRPMTWDELVAEIKKLKALVERLRKRDKTTYDLVKMLDEAADEIEHLNGIIKTAMGGKRAFEDRIALIKEIERLRADLQFAYENKSASDDTWRKECAATIERCALAVNDIDSTDGSGMIYRKDAVAAIRALKNKL